MAMVLGFNLKLSPRFNLISDKYSDKFSIFRNETAASKNLISIIRKDKDGSNSVLKSFAFKSKTKE